MGFICQKCHKITKSYEKQHKILITKRDKVYHYYVVKVRLQRGKTKEIYTEIKPDERDRSRKILREFTTRGWEIVKELKTCGGCANVKT